MSSFNSTRRILSENGRRKKRRKRRKRRREEEEAIRYIKCFPKRRREALSLTR